MNIEVVAETEAGFDAAQQANDVETAMVLDPDIILSLTIDPVSAAEGFRPAVDAGVQLVFLSTTPEGYRYGEEFVGVVTDDLAAMGIAAANLLGDSPWWRRRDWLYLPRRTVLCNQPARSSI